jgi:hypothetical protein
MNVHPAIATPLAAFDEAGVRWCLLRGADALADLEHDVDLLVHPEDLAVVRRVLPRAGGFAEVRAWGRGPHRFFVAGRAKLDVVDEVAFGRHQELPTRAGEAVLARRVRDGGLARPAQDDAFWLLLLHVLLDRSHLRPRRAGELRSLAPAARAGGAPLAALVDAAAPPGWTARRIADAAEQGRFEELLALAPRLRAGWPDAPRVATAARAGLRGALRRADRRRPRRARVPA